MTDIEIRTCQGCRKSSVVYRDGFYELVKYGVRHYAHAICLAKKFGTDAARAMIPEHQRSSFTVAIATSGDDWDEAQIEVKDEQIRDRARREAELDDEPFVPNYPDPRVLIEKLKARPHGERTELEAPVRCERCVKRHRGGMAKACGAAGCECYCNRSRSAPTLSVQNATVAVMAKNRGPGRPPRANKAAGERFEMRATGGELKAWERAAKAAGKASVSAWLRELANEAAKIDVPPG